MQAHSVEPGLRHLFVPTVAALVFRAPRDALARRVKLVQDVRVVERERAQPEHEHRCDGRRAECARREAAPRRPQSCRDDVLATAHPEQRSADQQQRRPRGPVELQYEPRPDGPAEAEHVGVRPPGIGPEDEERVLDAEARGEHGEAVDEEHEHVSDVLV